MTSDPVVFYYRNGCHLCEEMAAVLFRGWPGHAAAMEWRDVDSNAQWSAVYGDLVPVLRRGDDTICASHPDLRRIAQYFGANTNPV